MGIENPQFNLGEDARDTGPTPQSPEHNSGYNVYRPAITKLVAEWESQNVYDNPSEIHGEIDGVSYTVNQPGVRPNQGFVGLVEFQQAGTKSFSCVIKKEQSSMVAQVADYRAHVAAHPTIRKYTPQVYDLIGNWAILEKLSGLEDQELEQKLQTDTEFLNRYAEKTYATIQELAANKLHLEDVHFVDGHNCMVDPVTAESRMVEIKNVKPSPYLEPNEIVTEKLQGELGQVAQRPTPYRIAFAFELLRNAIKYLPPEQLAVRARVVKPTHPQFRNAYYVDNHEPIDNDLYQNVLASAEARERFTMPLPGIGGTTHIVSPELVAAVQTADNEKFTELLLARKHKVRIQDKTHPLYEPLIVPDDVP